MAASRRFTTVAVILLAVLLATGPVDAAPQTAERPAPLAAYDARLAEAHAAFAAAVDAAAADRQVQHDRADARFRDRVAAAAGTWHRAQQDANARTLAEFRKDLATVRRSGDLVVAEEIQAAQEAFIDASVEEARAFERALADTVPTAATAAPQSESVLVEVRVTGESALHITAHGLHWENVSAHRKPDGVTVDGKPWPLQWSAPDRPNSPDTSARLGLPLDPTRTTVELVYATNGPRGTGGRRPNSVITTRLLENEIVVSLTDHAVPAGYYGLRVRGLRPEPATPATPAEPDAATPAAIHGAVTD